MKITMIQTVSTADQTYQKGHTYNLDDHGARAMLNGKVAVAEGNEISEMKGKVLADPTDIPKLRVKKKVNVQPKEREDNTPHNQNMLEPHKVAPIIEKVYEHLKPQPKPELPEPHSPMEPVAPVVPAPHSAMPIKLPPPHGPVKPVVDAPKK